MNIIQSLTRLREITNRSKILSETKWRTSEWRRMLKSDNLNMRRKYKEMLMREESMS